MALVTITEIQECRQFAGEREKEEKEMPSSESEATQSGAEQPLHWEHDLTSADMPTTKEATAKTTHTPRPNVKNRRSFGGSPAPMPFGILEILLYHPFRHGYVRRIQTQ